MIEIINSMEVLGFYSFDSMDVYIINNPKAYFHFEENQEKGDMLIKQIDSVVLSGFGHELGDGVDGTRNHVVETSLIALAVLNNKIIGFASCKIFPFFDYQTFFLHGVAVDDNCKGRGIGFKLVSLLYGISRMEYIALTTQNPIMYSLIRKMSKNIYPSLDSVSCEDYLPLIRRMIRILDRPGFFYEKDLTYYDLYSQCLYERIPVSRCKDVDNYFKNKLRMDSNRQTLDGLFILSKAK